jgi:hypothetical protein
LIPSFRCFRHSDAYSLTDFNGLGDSFQDLVDDAIFHSFLA